LQYTKAGASFVTNYPGEGSWKVLIPWEVARDALKSEKFGPRATAYQPGPAELKTWMSENETEFTGIVFARLGLSGRPGWEDERITFVELSREEPEWIDQPD
jgi:hypothetical protein